MCGICGVIDPGRPAEVDTVVRMRDALAHRGPDGSGLYQAAGVALGHRRLAIIDLSDGGRQPFASADGKLQLIHNGEIYNYLELRRELEGKGHRFRTATDTEVLLASYREWGERCVERFNGMWAFAIWDTERRRLFCSRDRFGVKPFYYRFEESRFVFASELKAFRHDPRHPLAANLHVVRDYLEQGRLDHTAETFFAGILSLPAAHSLVVDSAGLQVTRYWALERRDPPAGDAAERFRELFLDAVLLRLRSDVPIGTALSGGLDSSAIACAVDHLLDFDHGVKRTVGSIQNVFSAFFEDPGLDERPYARAVIDQTGATAHWVSFSSDELLESLPAIVEAQDEPFGSTSIVAQWHVMKAAAQSGVKVMLDGQGGDEVLAGYPAYWGSRFADLLATGSLVRLWSETSAYRRVQNATVAATAVAIARPFVPEPARVLLRARRTGAGALVGPRLTRESRERSNGGGPYPDHLRQLLHLILTRQGLPELLHYEDRNSMAHSVEARVPFLDYRLVEFLFSLPGSQLLHAGRTKHVLRDGLHDLLPEPVARRTDKLGFETPHARFFRERLGELAADVFASKPFADRGFVNPPAARARLEAHRNREVDAGFELWRALSLELWARAFLDA
jgi:asparagine synthase (glutamine-hydrolysing)